MFICVYLRPKLLLLLIPLCACLGQSSFEVASIKPADPEPIGHRSIHRSVDEARLSYTNVSLRDVIKTAYGVQDEQVSGPEWLESARFNILAKIPADIPKEKVNKEVPKMLETLLAERFGLKVHRETKTLSRFALTVAKGGAKMPKAEEAKGTDGQSNRTSNHVVGTVTMEGLTDMLARELHSPITDETGLSGAFKIDIEWAADPKSPDDPPPTGPSLFSALQDQLGLKLTGGKGPVDVIVIDHVEKVPTEN